MVKQMKYNKYSNKKTKVDDIVFSSKKEAKRYQELKILLRCKKIHDLVLQPSYILQNAFKHENKTHRSIKYVSDFRYTQDGKIIVEDVKGFKTDIYNLKKKLFLFKYGRELIFREIN